MRLRWDVGLGRDLGLAFWAMTFFEATFGAYMSIWPLWIEELGAPIAVVGLVLGSAGFIRPFVIGPSSWLIERFDRQRLMMTARLIGVAGMLVAAFAQAWQVLFISVVLNSISEIVFPLLQTYVAERARENRARAFSLIINVGPSIALMTVPLLSGLLIAIWGMRSAFILASITSLISIFILSRMDLSLTHEEDGDESAAPTYQATFRNGPVRTLFAIHGLTMLSLAIGISLVSIFLRETRGMDAALISSLGATAAIGTALFGLVVARTPALSNFPMRGAAMSASAVVIGLVLFVATHTLPWITLAFFLRGGVFATWALILAEMGNIAPARLRSRAFAVVEILGGSAMSFGPIVASFLYEIEPSAPILAGAVLGGVMAIVMGWMQLRSGKTVPKDTTPILA